MGQLASKNPLCPKGHRHLLTMPDAKGFSEAYIECIDTFGFDKVFRATFYRGHYGPTGVTASTFNTPWKVHATGWTAFLKEEDFPLHVPAPKEAWKGTERDTAIIECLREGKTLYAVARKFGLTYMRIWQIRKLAKQAGVYQETA